MRGPSVNLKLVSAPEPVRRCQFCSIAMYAIELAHGCPERRLAYGLQQLRIDFRRQISTRRARQSRSTKESKDGR